MAKGDKRTDWKKLAKSRQAKINEMKGPKKNPGKKKGKGKGKGKARAEKPM